MPLASALLPLGRGRVVSPAEHPPAPVPPLSTSPLLSHSSAPLPSGPTAFGTQCSSPRAGQPLPVSIWKRFHFSDGHGPLAASPNIPPGFFCPQQRSWGGVAHRGSCSLSVCPAGRACPPCAARELQLEAPGGLACPRARSATPLPPATPLCRGPRVTQGPSPSSWEVLGRC